MLERDDSRSFFSIKNHQVVTEVMKENFLKMKQSSDESPSRFLPNFTHIKIEGNEQRTVFQAIHSAVFLIQRINTPINKRRRKIKAVCVFICDKSTLQLPSRRKHSEIMAEIGSNFFTKYSYPFFDLSFFTPSHPPIHPLLNLSVC